MFRFASDLAASTARLAATIAIGGVASCVVGGCFEAPMGGLVGGFVLISCAVLFVAGLLGFFAWHCARCAAAALCPDLAHKVDAAAGAVLGSKDASFTGSVSRLAVGVLAAAVIAVAVFSLTGNTTEATAVPSFSLLFFMLSVFTQAVWRGAAKVLTVLGSRSFSLLPVLVLVSLLFVLFLTMIAGGAGKMSLRERVERENENLAMVQRDYTLNSDIHAHEHALRSAAENGHLSVIEFLVAHNADIHAHNESALRSAAKNGHLPVVEFLKAHAQQ
jgi:hypothetical protein